MCPEDGGSKHFWNVSKLYQTTLRNIPEDSHIHAGGRGNLKISPSKTQYVGGVR
jgi:hypothetical protein